VWIGYRGCGGWGSEGGGGDVGFCEGEGGGVGGDGVFLCSVMIMAGWFGGACGGDLAVFLIACLVPSIWLGKGETGVYDAFNPPRACVSGRRDDSLLFGGE